MAVAGFDIGASVVYHSDSGAITAPAAQRLERMAAPPIAHYPEQATDSHLEVVKDFAKRVTPRTKNAEVHIYQNAKDRFHVEDGPDFDAWAASLAINTPWIFLNRCL